MGYYDEDFYYEPSEFDGYIEELKVVLAKSIKEEFVNEMEKLRIENEELQDVKRRFDDIKREYKNKEYQLEAEKTQLLQKVRRERLSELMKDFEVIMYKVYSKRELLPKCDKCDEQRRIKYKTPRGKDAYEDCDCKIGFIVWYPEEYVCTELSMNQDKKLSAFYKLKKSYSDEYLSFDSSSTFGKIFYNSEMRFEDINQYDTFFKSMDDCQAYCDYLNQKQLYKITLSWSDIKHMDDESVIGKRAYRKTGFFSYRIGTVQVSDSGITKYKIVFDDGGSVGVNFVDLVIFEYE